MLAILSLLFALLMSLLITRIATVALTYTGLSKESARFQARSAFTGTGFTTSESEKIVNHPVRRRIVLLLMLFGNVGIAAVLASLVVTFVRQDSGTTLIYKMLLLISGVAVLWAASASKWVDRQLSRIISHALSRYTNLEVRDYASLLHLAGEYKVSEMHIDQGDWLANRVLAELKLRDEGLLVLGVERENGEFIGAPNGGTRILEGDKVIIYGRDSTVAELSQRQRGVTGDMKHDQEVTKTERVREVEKHIDELSDD
jgi:K+/H+ antiporter YhaU regulatory subunit KhtT